MNVTLDFIAFILSLIMLARLFWHYKKIDSMFMLIEIFVTISCAGRYIISISNNLDMALLGNTFMYIGGCYLPIILVNLLFRFDEIKIPRIINILITTFSTVIFSFITTTKYQNVYYKDVRLVITDTYSYLEKSYGPAHILYPIMMALYALFLVVFIAYGLKNRSKISKKSVIVTAILGLTSVSCYLIEMLIDAKMSLLSFSYLVTVVYLIGYFDRMNMYDMSANVISAVEKHVEYGYIVFDKKFRFIKCNKYIKNVFPEISKWSIDSKVEPSDSMLYTQIVDYLLKMEWQESESRIVCINNNYFEVSIKIISHGNIQAGYLIEFIDRTIEREYYNNIENYNTILEKEVKEQTKSILHIKDMMVLGMADMVESRDNNTGSHIKRTSEIVRIFSRRLMGIPQLGFDKRFLKMVEKAAPMHDLGKISIDDVILRKPGKFTDEEYNEMKRHTTEGAKIVVNILQGVEDDDFVSIARNVALYHHEKYNGRGYPTGLAGEDIPVEARIMALADVFDALVSKRCYKNAFSFDEAFEIIEKDLGEHFDPELGRVFIECREELEMI